MFVNEINVILDSNINIRVIENVTLGTILNVNQYIFIIRLQVYIIYW